MRLVPEWNHELTMRTADTVFTHSRGKVYEHNMGKVLHSAGNL